MPKRLDLSQAVLKLRSFYGEAKRPPSYEEIRRLLGYKSKNAAFWLVRQLEEKGLIRKDAQGKLLLGAPGGIRLLGAVQAGFPSPAEEELLDTLSLDEWLVQNPHRSFLIKVTGDSMIEAGIREKDLVIVERGRDPQKGDIVIAQVDGEWTMKYYEKDKRGAVTLRAANPKYPPITAKTELVLGGIVVAVIRKYR